MYKKSNIILVVSVIVLLGSCNTSRSVAKHTTSKSAEYKSIAKKSFVKNINYNFNVDRAFVICSGNTTKLTNNISFFVYSLESNTVVTGTIAEIERVDWESIYKVVYFRVPGTISVDGDDVSPLYINLRKRNN